MENAPDMAEILRCSVDRWTGMWGDPLLPATVAMLCYAFAGTLLWRGSARLGGSERRLWRICALFFFFQVVNTHLDVHAWPTSFGYCLAHAQGWYAERGPLKLAAAVLIGSATALMLLIGMVVFWRSIRANALLVAGAAIAVGVTLLRGLGWSAAERFYNQQVGPFRWAVLIELAGIALAVVAALLRQRRLGPARLDRPLSRY